jgi:hypothetical protein
MGFLRMFERIILYREQFPLGKGLSLSNFIKNLDKKDFSPFLLFIEGFPLFYLYDLHFEYNFPFLTPFTQGVINPFSSLILLPTGLLRYSKNKRELVLEVSVGLGSLLFYLIIFCFYAILFISMILLGYLWPSFFLTGVLLWWIVFVARRDIERWKKIHQLAIEGVETKSRQKSNSSSSGRKAL